MQQHLDPSFEHHHLDHYIPYFCFLAKFRIRSELAFNLFSLLYSLKKKTNPNIIVMPVCVCNDSPCPKNLNNNLCFKVQVAM